MSADSKIEICALNLLSNKSSRVLQETWIAVGRKPRPLSSLNVEKAWHWKMRRCVSHKTGRAFSKEWGHYCKNNTNAHIYIYKRIMHHVHHACTYMFICAIYISICGSDMQVFMFDSEVESEEKVYTSKLKEKFKMTAS